MTNRRTRRPRGRDDSFWSDYVRSGSFDPATPTKVPPTVAEAELLLEEARQAEAEGEAAAARQAEEDRRRRASVERETVADVDTLEGATALRDRDDAHGRDPTGREFHALSRGFLHGFAPRGFKRMPPEDVIATRDEEAARLLDSRTRRPN